MERTIQSTCTFNCQLKSFVSDFLKFNLEKNNKPYYFVETLELLITFFLKLKFMYGLYNKQVAVL